MNTQRLGTGLIAGITLATLAGCQNGSCCRQQATPARIPPAGVIAAPPPPAPTVQPPPAFPGTISAPPASAPTFLPPANPPAPTRPPVPADIRNYPPGPQPPVWRYPGDTGARYAPPDSGALRAPHQLPVATAQFVSFRRRSTSPGATMPASRKKRDPYRVKEERPAPPSRKKRDPHRASRKRRAAPPPSPPGSPSQGHSSIRHGRDQVPRVNILLKKVSPGSSRKITARCCTCVRRKTMPPTAMP